MPFFWTECVKSIASRNTGSLKFYFMECILCSISRYFDCVIEATNAHHRTLHGIATRDFIAKHEQRLTVGFTIGAFMRPYCKMEARHCHYEYLSSEVFRRTDTGSWPAEKKQTGHSRFIHMENMTCMLLLEVFFLCNWNNKRVSTHPSWDGAVGFCHEERAKALSWIHG